MKKVEVECWLTLYGASNAPMMAGAFEWSATYKGTTQDGEDVTVEVSGVRGRQGEAAVTETLDMLRSGQRFLITIEPAEVPV